MGQEGGKMNAHILCPDCRQGGMVFMGVYEGKKIYKCSNYSCALEMESTELHDRTEVEDDGQGEDGDGDENTPRPEKDRKGNKRTSRRPRRVVR